MFKNFSYMQNLLLARSDFYDFKNKKKKNTSLQSFDLLKQFSTGMVSTGQYFVYLYVRKCAYANKLSGYIEKCD